MKDIEQQVQFLINQFSNGDLPGEEAMLAMAPLSRRQKFTKAEDFKVASVLLLLYRKNGELFFPLIERTSHNKNDKHRGQISLPGGKYELNDLDEWTCALREANEELGIPMSEVKNIGAMTVNYIPVSNFEVHPFVGYMDRPPHFIMQRSEVKSYFEISLKDLLWEKNKKTGSVNLSGGILLNDIPYFELAGKKVWGATAMILNEFIHIANKINI